MEHMKRFIVAAAIALAGCSMSADVQLAEQAVPMFHEMLDGGQFAAIYAAASDDFKKSTTQKDFVALLDAVHRKLGTTKSSKRDGFSVNSGTSGIFVTLNYTTIYTEGNATEQFSYRLQDHKALLANYTINSLVLITK